MLTERSKVPSEQKKRDFFPAKNPVDARREVVPGIVFTYDYSTRGYGGINGAKARNQCEKFYSKINLTLGLS